MAWEDQEYRMPPGNYGHFSPRFRRLLLYRLARWLYASVPVARLGRCQFRLHWSFLLLLFLALTVPGVGPSSWGLRLWGLLLGSVLLHELGHWVACLSVGGLARRVLLWPLGGLTSCQSPHRPRAELITVLAGPLVTLVLTVASYLCLALWLAPGAAPTLNPLHLLQKPLGDNLSGLFYDLFAINYLLLLLNLLLPFEPLDCARLVHVGLWSRLGLLAARPVALRVAMTGGALAAMVAAMISSWLLLWLGLMGLLGGISQYRLWQRSQGDKPAEPLPEQPDYGASLQPELEAEAGAAAEIEPAPEPPAASQRSAAADAQGSRHWRETGGRGGRRPGRRFQRQARELRRLNIEVDRILIKVKSSGMASLTRAELRTLHRATALKRELD